MNEITRQILDQIPSNVKFSEEDAELLIKHKDKLLEWEDGLIEGFYDSLFNHDTTRAVFEEGERPAREQTLRDWYRRTLNGPFDDNYWEWQTYVGLVHIKRKVNNAMVAGMWGWIATYLGRKALEEFPQEEALKLISAVHSLQANVTALIVESYLKNMFVAIDKAAGLSEALLGRLVATEIDDMLAKAKSS